MTRSEKQKMLAGELYHAADPEISADLAAAMNEAPDTRATLELSRLEGYANMLAQGMTFSAFLGHFDRGVWEKLNAAYPMEEEEYFD